MLYIELKIEELSTEDVTRMRLVCQSQKDVDDAINFWKNDGANEVTVTNAIVSPSTVFAINEDGEVLLHSGIKFNSNLTTIKVFEVGRGVYNTMKDEEIMFGYDDPAEYVQCTHNPVDEMWKDAAYEVVKRHYDDDGNIVAITVDVSKPLQEDTIEW